MSEGSEARLRLSEFLVELRAELSRAQWQTEKDNLNFVVDVVTLELDIAYTFTQSMETPTKVKPEFWVLGRGARGAEDAMHSAHWNAQHVILRLTPRLEDVDASGSEFAERMSRLPPKRRADTE